MSDPVWKQNGYKSKAEALEGIMKHLLDNQQAIVSKGFRDDVPIQFGTQHTLILHGKTKRVGEGKGKTKKTVRE